MCKGNQSRSVSLKVLFSAAETSSDAHGAKLIEAIRDEAKKKNQEVEFIGLGGPNMKRAGLRILFDARELLVIGFWEIVSHLPVIFRALKVMADAAKRENPDVAVVIDYPGFHFRLARKLKLLGIPTVYYIPPKVWAWKKGRVKFLREFFVKVLCILPFEEKFYKKEKIAATFVGNPLVDELPLKMTRSEARKELGLEQNEKILLLMPGSRAHEFKYHFDKMLSAANEVGRMRDQNTPLKVLLPLPETANLKEIQGRLEKWKSLFGHPSDIFLDVRLSLGNSAVCMVAADAGIIKSGTSTLEAALLNCPHLVAYDASLSTHFIYRHIVRYRGPIGLSNLVLSTEILAQYPFREFVGPDMTVDALAKETNDLLNSSERRNQVSSDIEKVRSVVLGKGGTEFHPSSTAAKEIFALIERESNEIRVIYPSLSIWKRPFVWALSSLWSALNAIVRSLYSIGLFTTKELDAKRVISIGNIQAGGAGKTPLVVKIACEAISRGQSVCILMRGVGSRWEGFGGIVRPASIESVFPDTADCGDEAALIHEKVPEAWIGVGANRIQQYEEVKKEASKEFDLVLLDDGFQHWKIHRDVELVALTSARPNQKVFRENFSALDKADLLVWTKGVVEPLRQGNNSPPMVKVRYQLETANGASNKTSWLVSGIGDNEHLNASVAKAGYKITKHLSFSDHAAYTDSVVKEIVEDANQASCDLVVTGKDWVKWRNLPSVKTLPKGLAIHVLEPALDLVSGNAEWEKVLWGNEVRGT